MKRRHTIFSDSRQKYVFCNDKYVCVFKIYMMKGTHTILSDSRQEIDTKSSAHFVLYVFSTCMYCTDGIFSILGTLKPNPKNVVLLR